MNNSKLYLTIFLVGFVLGLPTQMLGHAGLSSPAPRNSNTGIKSAPCGGLARTNKPTVLTPGQDLVVNWKETIQHPGKFIISFSAANDANFQVLATIPDTQNSTADLPHMYSSTVKIPTTPCSACTLQLIQSMEENPAQPTYYYSCADIQIAAPQADKPDLTVTALDYAGVNLDKALC